MGSSVAIAVPVALLGATSFAVSSVLQQRAARKAPEDESLSWRLILDLLHRGTWLAGMGCVLLGYVLQATSLDFGPIAIVEPVIGLEIVIALPLAARLKGTRLGLREWLGAGCVVAGVGGFLALSEAAGGNSEPPLVNWGEIAVPVAVVVAAALLLARGPEGPKRASFLAVAAAVTFGLMALVTQSLVVLLSHGGILAVLESWQIYAIAAIGPIGFMIGQSAYQSGPLAFSLPILDSLEPASSVLLAAVAFHQHISLQPGHLAGELAGAAIAIGGIFLLGHSPLVLSIYEQTQKAKEGHEPSEDDSAAQAPDAARAAS